MKPRPLAHWLVKTLLAGLPVPAVGADLEALLELSPDSLLEVRVVTASKHSQSALDAAAPVNVVTAEDIRTFGYRTLGDILRAMPGLWVSYDRSYAYLGVRGINRKDFNERILVLLDGRRLNENMYDSSQVDRTFLVDLELIDRVELVAGPGSSLYGNNAMLGVVNVITKQGRDLGGGRLLAESGDAQGRRVVAQYGNRLDNGTDVLLAVSGFRSAGQDLFFPERGSALGLDGEEAQRAFAKVSHGDLTLSTAISQRGKDIPTAPYGTLFNDPDARIQDRQGHLAAGYEHALTPTLDLSLQASLGSYDFRNDYHYGSADPDPLNHDQVHGRWWNAEARLDYRGLDGHRILAGIEYQSDYRQDYRNWDVDPYFVWYDQTGSSRRHGLYLDDRIQLGERWQLDLGVRYDRYSIRGTLTDCSADPCASGPFATDGSSVNPRVALIYKPRPDTAVKLLYGSAFRAANPTEIVFVIPGQPLQISDTVPERLTTRELTLEHFPNPNLRLWVDGFQYDFEGLIDTDPATNAYINTLDFRSRGILLGGEWRSPDGWLLRASYTYADVTDADGARLDDAPRHLAKLAYAMPLAGDWRLGVEAQYTDARLTLSGRELSGYGLLNLTLTSGKRWKDLEVSASVYNLLDSDYADPGRSTHTPIDAIPQDGRGWRLQAVYKF